MPWRPSVDPTIQRLASTSFWTSIQTLFNNAVPFAPQPRRAHESLKAFYVRRRRGDHVSRVDLGGRLPPGFSDLALGETDVDLLDFLLNMQHDRILRLEGPRGSGKTSLIHFAEFALSAVLPPMSCPQLLIINGNSLAAETATLESVGGLLAEELARRADSSDDSFGLAFAAAKERISDDRSPEACIEALGTLVQHLPNRNAKLITVVFDNLDQHSDALLDQISSLARAMFIRTGVGAVMSMRPGSWGAAMKRPRFRAVFGYRLEVHAPSVDEWLESLGARVAREAEARRSDRGTEGSLEPHQFRVFFRRLSAALIGNKRGSGDVFSILDSVAADDTRHLILLIRRLLSNRDLPASELLSEANNLESVPFRPLRCMIEGERLVFKANNVVPNLLCFHNNEGAQELLLLHRILRLLDTVADAAETSQLLGWLNELGYNEELAASALPVLTRSLLIRSPDGERFAPGAPLPLELAITDAGRFYLNHMLHTPDYLTAVVLDVPLEHAAVPELGADSFAARVESLLEYSDRVRRYEDRQIQQLARRPPSRNLSRVAEALLAGGLLTASILRGLERIERQGRVAQHQRVQQVVGVAVSRAIFALRSWRDGAEERLQQRVARGEKVRAASSLPPRWSRSGFAVQLIPETIGGDLRVRVATSGGIDDSRGAISIVAIQSFEDAKQLFQASLLHPQGGQGVGDSHSTVLSEIDAAGTDVAKLRPQVLTIPGPIDPNRVGLLIVEEEGDHFRLKLQVVSSMSGPVPLSALIHTADTVAWCKERTEEIAGLAMSGKPIFDALRALGVQLYTRLLSPDGQNRLAHYSNLLDTVIMCSRLLAVPWELMCPPASNADPQPAIGDTWRMFRWSADPINGLAMYLLATPGAVAAPLKTVGLSSDKGRSWRQHDAFTDYAGFRRHCADAGTLHLCGHWSGQHLNIEGCALRIAAPTVTADGLPGPTNVLVSSCGAAAETSDANLPLAITMAAGGKRVAWSPLVTISESNAKEIDEALHAFLNADSSRPMELFMREMRPRLPILSLYVRYGVSRS